MKYSITWALNSVCVNYVGEIDNSVIESAHLELNGDERFYDCRRLILNITGCNLDSVSVPDLDLVVAIDLGASKVNKKLKVAMIANEQSSINKANDYIKRLQRLASPWNFEIFGSVNDASVWLDA